MILGLITAYFHQCFVSGLEYPRDFFHPRKPDAKLIYRANDEAVIWSTLKSDIKLRNRITDIGLSVYCNSVFQISL